MSGFLLHPEAVEDIDEIAAYIGQESPEAARRVVQDLFSGIEKLTTFAHRGHERRDLTDRPLRFLRVRDYLVAYQPDEKLSG